MGRAHLYRPVTDSSGNIVPNTVVTLYEAGTLQLLVQPIWSDPVSSAVASPNPWTTSDGYINIYLDKPQTVRVGLTVQGAAQTFIENVSVLPPPENLVVADIGFQVQNAAVAGQFLQAGQPGVAAWVNAGDLVNSRPSPLNQIKAYDWSGGALDDTLVTDANGVAVVPTYPDVTADPKPSGSVFTKALQMPTTGPVTVRTPAEYFPENGAVVFLYKVVSAAQGVGAAVLHVAVDNDVLFVETPTSPSLLNTWLVGYLDQVPPGSHQISFRQTPGTDPTSVVRLGPVTIQYGNNIPAHEHPGGAIGSTRIGTGAVAAYIGDTVVGASASALDMNATAFGYGAQAGLNGTAFGASAGAGTDAVAVGSGAGNSLLKVGTVAVGKNASASDDQAVAIGSGALARGNSSVALGVGAATGTPAGAVAVGPTAQALAINSVALGSAALVAAGHDYSIAIGPGVATTAAHQAMIGDSQTTLVVPGSLRTTGGDATFGGPTSKLGFYGAAGIVKPTVVGSRGGNATLASLLTLLATMGLITDGSST